MLLKQSLLLTLALSLGLGFYKPSCAEDASKTETSEKTEDATKASEEVKTEENKDAATATGSPAESSDKAPPPRQHDDETKSRKYKAQLHAFDGGKMLRKGNFRGAQIEFKAASNFEPENIQYHLGYASAAHQANDWSEALEAYKRILKTDPSHTEVHKTIAECLFKLGRYDESVEEYKKSLPFEKDKCEIWCRIASIRIGQARHNEAMDAYKSASKAVPGEGKPYRLLAAMQWQSGNKAEALATYRNGVHNAPKDGDLQAAYAYALMSNQEWKAAAEAYKTASMLKGATPQLQAGYKSAMEHIAYEEDLARRKAAKEQKHKKH
ncbi:MAG: tetratricopeptide repeat protein [Candidatus Obscuribacterales bacterium]|nr:tetratricopeptide repeat protein [Candidatus Obscuribacterales bacterium]